MRALALLALTACTHISDAEHQQRKRELGGDDTALPSSAELEGTWTGEFIIDIDIVDGGAVDVPRCEGEMSAVLTAQGESLGVVGDGSCESTDWVVIEATMTGTVDRLLDAAGLITLTADGGEAAEPEWTGAVDVAATPTLNGTFEFDFELPLRYSGHGDGRFALIQQEP